MKAITNEWLKKAEEDMRTIEIIVQEQHLTNISAFHAQQAVEKSFKAILIENDKEIVRTHSLANLFYRISEYIDFEIDMIALKRLDTVYTDTRYPAGQGLLPDGAPSIDEANEFYIFAKYIYENVLKTVSK